MTDVSVVREVSGTRPRTAALTAGIGMLVMTAIAAPVNFAIIQNIMVPENAQATAANLAAAAGTIRLGGVALVVVAVLDVVVAWGLYELLRPVSTGLSMVGAWLRVAYAATFALAIDSIFGAVGAASSDPATAARLVEHFNNGWMIGQIFFGVHLGIVGVLALRSRFIHWLFGTLLVVAGAGYLFDGITSLAVPGFGVQLAVFTFIGEVLFMLWLLIRGPRLEDARIGAG